MPRRPKKPVQQELCFPSWGGRRRRAGRPRRRDSGVAHLTRPDFAARYPAHITMKLVRELGSLRTKTKVKAIRLAITNAVADGFRVIDWSVQNDHIHMVVEASGATDLSRRMQGLSVRIARGLNRVLGRRGQVFADRYHVHVLRTPREVRHAKAYVMLNARRHAAQRGRSNPRDWMDPCSSWVWFDGWKDCPSALIREVRAMPDVEPCTAEPATWLMRVSWRRYGMIAINDVPGPCPK